MGTFESGVVLFKSYLEGVLVSRIILVLGLLRLSVLIRLGSNLLIQNGIALVGGIGRHVLFGGLF